jgi:DNA polymerase-3 subunit delta
MVAYPPSVLLFVGDDTYLKDKAIDKAVSSAIGSASKELNCRIFYGGESDLSGIVDYASTLPFLAARRVIVIRRFGEFSRKESALIKDIIAGLARHCLFILEADGKFSIEESGLHGFAQISRFDGVSGSDLRRWMADFIKTSGGKGITAQAVSRLEELQQHNLLSLSRELDKLVTFVGPDREIELTDVEELVGRNLEVSAFALTDAVSRKDVGVALGIVGELLRAGKRHHEIVGLISWYLRRLLKAKMLKAKGESEYSIARSLKIANRYAGGFFGELKAFTAEHIKLKLELLLKADLEIKRADFKPALILENAILNLCLGDSTG